MVAQPSGAAVLNVNTEPGKLFGGLYLRPFVNQISVAVNVGDVL